ncbi:hypothetical protein [Legionella bononiensis]|uniref:Uncharacterized protein n=1 Tax=Legionella bononiensis TaxID=2793102 RepID=A0ABS1WF88_9GAMM|nr:hypothetical protein [Legionella bononiensis]MBL7479267.1 hypothetical protein [Legionella bononiensis]MBL7528005.1 hypothetical protein [Legionella bononiensis]MBL7563918.1 hypothetical protein [Legionella bononiensis]
MKVAFFISSAGDTDLALKTIKAMELKNECKTVLVSLTKTADERVNTFESTSLLQKYNISGILNLVPGLYPASISSEEQRSSIINFVEQQQFDYVYLGVPSVNNTMPFQIAEFISDKPVLIAYEYMFKSDAHCLWQHVPLLKEKANVQWAVPLKDALNDFELVDQDKLHITGHLSIDNAFLASPATSSSIDSIREQLQVPSQQSLAFISSTTQPVSVDEQFIECVLQELQQTPNMHVRLGLHPGIQDFDTYLEKILSVYRKYPAISAQFKIILPENIVSKIKLPELSINAPEYQDVFLRVNINGNDAACAADRVAQAVPGALLNQAILEGKPAYSHLGKPYLPQSYFSSSISGFFAGVRQSPKIKSDLGLDERTAPERFADLILK